MKKKLIRFFSLFLFFNMACTVFASDNVGRSRSPIESSFLNKKRGGVFLSNSFYKAHNYAIYLNTDLSQQRFKTSTLLTNKYKAMLFVEMEEEEKSVSIFQKTGHIVGLYFKDTWHVFTSPTRLNRKSAAYVGGVVLVSAGLYAYDEEILNAFRRNRDNRIYNPFLEVGHAIEPIGNMGKTNKYYFAGLVFGTIFKIDKLQEVTLQILESHFIGGGFKNIANVLVGRSRPFQDKGPRDFKFNGGTSFPSGHASSSFQVAAILSHHANYWPASVLFYGLATTIAFQRIDDRGHWPSDVFVGAVYGTAIGKAVVGLHERRKVKVVPEYSPETNAVGLRLDYHFN